MRELVSEAIGCLAIGMLHAGVRYAGIRRHGQAIHLLELDPARVSLAATGDGAVSECLTVMDTIKRWADRRPVACFAGMFANYRQPLDRPEGGIVRDGATIVDNLPTRSGRTLARSYLAQDGSSFLIGDAMAGQNVADTLAHLDGHNIRHFTGGLARLLREGRYCGAWATKEQAFGPLVMSPYIMQPRTAAGIMANGNLLVAIHASGAIPVYGGATTTKLAEFLQAFGCADPDYAIQDAVMFDGGGSNCLVIPKIGLCYHELPEPRKLPTFMVVLPT